MRVRGRLVRALEEVHLEVTRLEPPHREAEVGVGDRLEPEHVDVEPHRLLEVVRDDADVVEPDGARHQVASRCGDVAGEVHRGQRLAGRPGEQPVPADGLARAEDPLREEPPGLAPSDEPSGLPLERRGELGGDEVPVEVGVVVDGRAGDVDLGGPVGRGAPGGRREELVAGDEPPPERVEVGLGIGVERALEVRHHEHPTREHEHLGRAGRIEARLQLGRLGGVDARDLARSHPASCARRPMRIAMPSVTVRWHPRSSHGRPGSMPRSKAPCPSSCSIVSAQ